LKLENPTDPITLAGDRAALKHALAEVMLNALQANPTESNVAVRSQMERTGNGRNWVHLDIQDSGTGFTPEAAKKALEPFFTTRNVGLGLGLAVAGKIIATHHGRLIISEQKSAEP